MADVVWRAFGADVNNYVEPFAGSLAVLLARPGGPGKIETVNDISRYLANFWRAIAADPDAVAKHCDWPVNEADLHARHRWLVDQLPALREAMHKDPHFYDAKIAGWWVWGICQWIGGGWCAEPEQRKRPRLPGDYPGIGVHSDAAHRRRGVPPADPWNKRPNMSNIGNGVHSDAAHPKARMVNSHQRPAMQGDSTGMGVHSERHQKMPAGDTRRGVHRQQLPKLDGAEAIGGIHAPRLASGWNVRPDLSRHPDLTNAHGVHLPGLGNDRGLNGVSAAPAAEWFRLLQARLRRVRVACGDWKRVLGPSVLGKGKNVGGRRPCAVFLDPPYNVDLRDPGLYADDVAGVSAKVREWALEHGDDPELRIALCGYEGEHAMPGWTEYAWKAARGYASEENENRKRERIWFSPHCLPIDKQLDLFQVTG